MTATKSTAVTKRTRKAPVKKGKPTWKPAQKLDVKNKKKGFTYRWVDKDPENINKKLAEGWVFANKDTGTEAEHEKPEDINDGQELTTATEYREGVLMALPEDVAEARKAYFQEQTDKQTAGLKNALKRELNQAAEDEGSAKAPVHGKIIIE